MTEAKTTLTDETLILEAHRLLLKCAVRLEQAAELKRDTHQLDPVGNFAFYAADADRLQREADAARQLASIVLDNLIL